MILTRQEKERLVIDLYDQGKSTRQIAQEVGISFRDIATIVRNAVKQKERENSISISSQAYTMFLEGKIPIQVAIKLNMQEAEVTKLYSEFLNLNGLHALSEIYQEINGNIRYFLELYRLAIKANMNIQNIMAVLKIADNDFPTLEANYWTLHKTLSGLEAEKQRSTIVIMELKDQIWGLENTKDSLQSDCRELSLELTKLRLQEIRLKDTINNIQNGVLRSKIKEVVKSQVERFLSDRQLIFRLAFEPIIKSMRRDYTIIPNAYHTAINHPTPLLDRALNIEMMTGENNEINSDH